VKLTHFSTEHIYQRR